MVGRVDNSFAIRYRSKILHRQCRALHFVLQLSRDLEVLSSRIDLCQGVEFGSAAQQERMAKPRYDEPKSAIASFDCPSGYYVDFGGGEPGILDRLGNLRRIKGLVLFGENDALAFHQADFGMINAIQALQGLLGPFGSKPSYHAADLDRRLLDLRGSRR